MIIEKIYPFGEAEDEITVIYSDFKIYVQFDGKEYTTKSTSHKYITFRRNNFGDSTIEDHSIMFWKPSDRVGWYVSTSGCLIPYSIVQKCYSKIDEISERIKAYI